MLRRLASGTAVVALSAALLTGCEWDDSWTCLSNADTISDNVSAIHEAGIDAIKDPTKTEDSIKTIEKNIDTINEKKGSDDNKDDKDNKKVDKAVDELNQSIEDYNRAILNGDSPDSTKIDRAAENLRDVCKS